jgi:hypothetical protein
MSDLRETGGRRTGEASGRRLQPLEHRVSVLAAFELRPVK